ncbi:MAG: SpoIID/LytB domain-containing protein [Candidatus Cloacimonetes bacterium]|nr:SpoIID/LytB domain-containing protein [Candidatus Cloacimonadota bacterium]
MRGLVIALLLLVSFSLGAAEYQNGQLYLEINLAAETQIQLKPLAANTDIVLSEQDGLFMRTLKGTVTISFANQEALTYYSILEHKDIASAAVDDSLVVTRDFFAWENQQLVIKYELLYFSNQSFSSLATAEQYASQNHISLAKIMEVPLINSTVKVSSDNGETMYLETPLKISCAKAIKINGSSFGFDGSFVLKTVNRKLVLNHFLPLEQYIEGVIPNEIGNNSPLEALKAQAVAARTHALSLLLNNRHKADGYDLCSSTHCQVYKGKHLMNDTILSAVHDCQGEALFIGTNLADATYHSSCGGKTDASSVIWKGKPIAHLNGVTCISEADSLDFSSEAGARGWIDSKTETAGMSSWERGALSWEKSITKEKLAANLGLTYISKIEILSRGRSGRITSMLLKGNKELRLDNEYKIRVAFGSLLSSFFYIKGGYQTSDGVTVIRPKGTIQLKGKGAGHGVGMCQVGALRMARQGKTYTEILDLYYPGTITDCSWMAATPKSIFIDAE